MQRDYNMKEYCQGNIEKSEEDIPFKVWALGLIFVDIAGPQKVISGFQAPRNATAPKTELEFVTGGSLQNSM
ncbi:hypothetical protein PoB_004472500 [Plakobranchus ocellatus]|uniref:Protein kinase domain-containing protein n=1 Tax=Plakobranchus ocellatus TaxID=259542 RepID=A0AAV4BC76_9GAST|nr:hypothetical protein PoB_004472500 [Plakobranchus ocellatus]